MGNCKDEPCPINSCGKELRISVPESFHTEDFFVFEGLYHRTEEHSTSQDGFINRIMYHMESLSQISFLMLSSSEKDSENVDR